MRIIRDRLRLVSVLVDMAMATSARPEAESKCVRRRQPPEIVDNRCPVALLANPDRLMPVRLDRAIRANPHVKSFHPVLDELEKVRVRARRWKQQLSIGSSIVNVVHAIWFENPRSSWHLGPHEISSCEIYRAAEQCQCRDGGHRVGRDGGDRRGGRGTEV